jgi:hypothetical protein
LTTGIPDVLEAFPAAGLQVGLVEPHRVPAQLMDADFEGNPGARALLGKEHAPGLPLQRKGVLPAAEPFPVRGHGEEEGDLSGGQVSLGEEVLHRKNRIT